MGEQTSDPVVVVAVVVDDDRIRSHVAGVLGEQSSYECREIDPGAVPDVDWAGVDVLVLDWNLPAYRRDAVVGVVRKSGADVGIFAVFTGVPESDPIGNGADHELQLPVDEDTFLTELRVTCLQQRYSTELAEVARAIAETDGDRGDAIDRAIARADETLTELSDHVSYVDLFRRLLEE